MKPLESETSFARRMQTKRPAARSILPSREAMVFSSTEMLSSTFTLRISSAVGWSASLESRLKNCVTSEAFSISARPFLTSAVPVSLALGLVGSAVPDEALR